MSGVDVYSAMQIGNPFKSYRKTILGKVFVTVWDNFKNEPKEVRLYGKPETAIIDVWSEKEDAFFKNMNRRLIEAGLIMPVNRANLPPQPEVKPYSDDDLDEILRTKFFKLSSILNSINDVITLTRLLKIAEDKEASEKIMKNIEARLSEVQTAEFHLPKAEVSEEK